MELEKWQALGNDYLIVEQERLPFELTPARVRRLCDVHFGVGADGVLLISRPETPAFVARLRIFNPDGSEAELSGNGAREAILYLRRRGWTDADSFAIETAAGPIHPTITGPRTCRVDMGQASTASTDFPSGPPDGRAELEADGRRWRFQHVSVGNPQCAIAVAERAELERLDLGQIGPAIERHALFPNRTNVSFWCQTGPGELRVRIFERGVGETLASGTGASGAAVAWALSGGTGSGGGEGSAAAPSPSADAAVRVELDGGVLEVEVGTNLQVHLTGWAVPVLSARLADELIEELRATE